MKIVEQIDIAKNYYSEIPEFINDDDDEEDDGNLQAEVRANYLFLECVNRYYEYLILIKDLKRREVKL